MNLHRMVGILLITLLLVGAFVAGEYASGSAAAQTKQKWEYQVIKMEKIDRTDTQGIYQVEVLSKLGQEGWEAVSISDSWCLLKRPQ